MAVSARIRSWIWALFSLAIVAFVLVFGGQIEAWLWGRIAVHKTHFTQQDEKSLKDFVEMQLPADARIDWAVFFHTFRGETSVTFRIQIPAAEAKNFQNKVESLGTRDEHYDPHLLDPDPEDETKPKLEAAFTMEDLKMDAIVFCKSENGDIPVYFEIEGWPQRDIHGLQGVFLPAK
jgi:hypothetical protein